MQCSLLLRACSHTLESPKQNPIYQCCSAVTTFSRRHYPSPQSVRIPPPLLRFTRHLLPCKTPVFWRLARREKRLDLGCATRNATPQAPCTELHGRYRSPGELARSAVFPGKSMISQRRTRDSNPQPVSRRLISNQVPNHSAILRAYRLDSA